MSFLTSYDLVGVVKLIDRVLEAEIEKLVLELFQLSVELIAGHIP